VSILRWPGGNFASGYNWKDGIGPKDQRPARPELAWNDVETNRFGTDEFLRYAEMIGTEPYICVNLGLGSIGDARDWVEYTNSSKHTYWADLRRKNGRDQPYNVKYWALGNEIDGPWQLGHKNAEEYSKFALEAAKAMRGIDPSIKLVASGSSNYGADWLLWNRTVLQTLRNTVDYIALHTYINNRANDFESYLGGWQQTVERYIDTTRGLIREVQTGPNPRPIYIAYDEWNVWYRAFNEKKLEEIYNFEDALAMGMFFNTFFRNADIVKMANLAQMVNVIAPIMTNEKGLFLQPIYFRSRIREAAGKHVTRRVGLVADLQDAEPPAGSEVSRRLRDLRCGGRGGRRQRPEPQQGQGHRRDDREPVGELDGKRLGLADEPHRSQGDPHVRRRSEGEAEDVDRDADRRAVHVPGALADDPATQNTLMVRGTMRGPEDGDGPFHVRSTRVRRLEERLHGARRIDRVHEVPRYQAQRRPLVGR
jgi:hypothetical protein